MRLYDELIPEIYREITGPEGFNPIEPDRLEFSQKTALIHCLECENVIVEVAALVIDLEEGTTYFH